MAWQPRVDTATVLKKTLERMAGTTLGAVLGLVVGFISLEFDQDQGQTIFIGCMLALHGFLYPYVADRMGKRSNYSFFLGMCK